MAADLEIFKCLYLLSLTSYGLITCPEMSMELPVMACQLYSRSYNEIHITINDIHNLNDIHG